MIEKFNLTYENIMKRISITLFDEEYTSIKKIMEQESIHSIAQCVRELINLAVKIKSEAANNVNQNDENELLDTMMEIKNFLKSGLSWTLETRLLTRFLVENHSANSPEILVEILEKYKVSASQYVSGLYGDKVD